MKAVSFTTVAFVALAVTSLPATAKAIANVESPTGLACTVVTAAGGNFFSWPTVDNPQNTPDLGTFIEWAGFLGTAFLSYQANPATAMQIYWDRGPADPNCVFNDVPLPQILNIRFTP